MIHQQIKDLFFSSVDSVVSDISKYTFILILISNGAGKFLLTKLSLFLSHKVLHPQEQKCLIFGIWIHTYQLLLP